jgi:alpha-D-ribose 1-methylphosphonate 5-triphosphate synthase subunit PhnH
MSATAPPTAPALQPAAIGRGFADPVHGAQQVFRCLLRAMSLPGQVQTLPATALAGFHSPTPGVAMGAALLCLLDAEARLWIALDEHAERCRDQLRFHTGVQWAEQPGQAGFVAGIAGPAAVHWWQQLDQGSDEAPQAGATLLLEVPSLDSGLALALRGPGIEHCQPLLVRGLAPDFWQARIALEADYPRGIDLLLCCGDRLVAIPRSTRITIEG